MKKLYPTLLVALFYAFTSAQPASAFDLAEEGRQELNRIFFNGRTDSERFVGNDGSCEFSVVNDLSDGSLEISITEQSNRRTVNFRIANGDPTVRRLDDEIISGGAVSLLAGVSRLDVETLLEAGSGTFRKSYVVKISDGLGIPLTCTASR